MVGDGDAIVRAVRRVGVREVARRTRLSPTTISRWINGRFALPTATMERIRKATGGAA